ncbi:MAG: DUF1294 domain-containing protein [Rikenellaceae bacterium]|nr:DUF1294 domain-containing protein [Rikenellaceae bacterium]
MNDAIYTYLLVANLITFVVYGIDKAKAKLDGWRIPEKTLLLLALVGGSIGAYAAMRIFRHKTKHPQFSIGIPVIFILQVFLAGYLIAQ